MTRYFFNFREPGDIVSDNEGAELPDIASAREQAIEGAREIMCNDVRKGILDLRNAVVVTDEAGEVVSTIRFRDAVQLHLE